MDKQNYKNTKYPILHAMRVYGPTGVAGLLFAVLCGCPANGPLSSNASTTESITAGSVSYSGRATAISVTANVVVLNPKVVIGDTGELNPSGEARDATAASVNVPLPVSVQSGTISATTSGSGNKSVSSVALQKIDVSVVGLLQISADAVDANSSAQCGSDASGTSAVANLTINGLVISTTVAPDATVTIPIPLVGSVTLNERTMQDANTIVVNAIHVSVNALGLAGTDVVIGHAESGIKGCP